MAARYKSNKNYNKYLVQRNLLCKVKNKTENEIIKERGISQNV